MSLFITFLIATIVSIVMIFAFSSKYKGEEKVDKGGALLYYKLSYRRKMIRTLWMIPFIFVAVFLLYWAMELTFLQGLVIAGIFLVLTLMQVAYNYVMWQKKEAV